MHPIFGDPRLNTEPFLRGSDPKHHPQQRKLIEALISDLDAATAELDARADALQETLQHIRNQRVRCRKLVEYQKCWIAPILSVPNDVLSAILDMCVQGSTSPAAYLVIDTAPLRLSHVCRRWRTLMFNSPLKWITKLVRHYPSTANHSSALPLFNFFLERAGSQTFPTKISLLGVRNLAMKFGSSANRWRALDLEQYDDDTEVTMADFGFPRPAPALEMLDYKLTLFDGGDTSKYFQPFEQCENIRDLRLVVQLEEYADPNTTARLINIAETRFPWSQLTKLCLNVVYPVDDAIGILRACPQLEDLRFCMDWEPPRGGGPILMARLVRLDLPFANILLESIHCPVLEELQLGSLNSKSIVAFLDASHPPIHDLRLWLDDMDIEGPIEGDIPASRLLSRFDTVDTLELNWSMSAISLFTSSPILGTAGFKHVIFNVPCSIWFVTAEECSTSILAFVGVLWRAEMRRLESVTVVATQQVTERLSEAYPPRDVIQAMPLLQELDVYRKEGLEVTVCVQPKNGKYYLL